MAVRYHRDAGPWTGKHVHYAGYDFHPEGMARCAVGPELRHAVNDIANNAVDFAELIAPADSHSYAAGFRTGDHIIPDFPNRQGADPEMPRVAAYLQNISPDAVLVEVGAKATRPYRILRRTLEWIELVHR